MGAAVMDDKGEVIALVLEAALGRRWNAREAMRRAKRLVRSSDGRVSLESIESEEEFERTARTTGCFQRGKAIRDPVSREIIGYEMERVSLLPEALGA
jgi:hypothetical protein